MCVKYVLLKQMAGTATAQVVHTQQRAVPATAAQAEVVAIATGQSVRAVTPVTASAVVSTNLTPGQSQTRTLVAPGRPNAILREAMRVLGSLVAKSIQRVTLPHCFLCSHF